MHPRLRVAAAGIRLAHQHPHGRQHHRPEDLTDEVRWIAADLPERHLSRRAKGAQVHRPDRGVHSRSARPVSERNTSSSETGTTSTCWIVSPALRAASKAAARIRAPRKHGGHRERPLCRSLRSIALWPKAARRRVVGALSLETNYLTARIRA